MNAATHYFALVTDREIQVIQQIALGYSSKQVASNLGIKNSTVMKHRKNILQKTGCLNTAHLVRCSLLAGVIS